MGQGLVKGGPAGKVPQSFSECECLSPPRAPCAAGRREGSPRSRSPTHLCPSRPGSALGRRAAKACRTRLPCLANGGSAGRRPEARPRMAFPAPFPAAMLWTTAPGGALFPGLQPCWSLALSLRLQPVHGGLTSPRCLPLKRFFHSPLFSHATFTFLGL